MRLRPTVRAVAALAVTAVALSLLALGAPSATAAPASTSQQERSSAGSSPCRPVPGAGLRVSISSPTSGGTVDLAAKPRFDITGSVDGVTALAVTKVQVFANGALIGSADLERPRWWSWQRRAWSMATSAPSGQHSLVVCARTLTGRVVGASTSFSAKLPPASATVLDPDVVQLDSKAVSSIASVTDTAVTFRAAPALVVGSVITAPPSSAAPKGLLRRVTAVSSTSGGTTVTTTPAGLLDVFVQADITTTIPSATASTAQPVPASTSLAPATTGRTEVVNAIAPLDGAKVFSAADATLTIPQIGLTKELSGKIDSKLGNAEGEVGVKGKLTGTLDTSVDVRLKIKPFWDWGLSVGSVLEQFRVQWHSTKKISADALYTGKGSFDFYGPPAIPAGTFAAGPLVFTGEAKFTVGVAGESTNGMRLVALTSQTSTDGFDCNGSSCRIIHEDSGTSDGSTAPVLAQDIETGTAKAYGKLTYTLELDKTVGAYVSGETGPKGTVVVLNPASPECTVRSGVGGYVAGKVGIQAKLVSDALKVSAEQTVAEHDFQVKTADKPCTAQPSVVLGPDTLPDAIAGTSWSKTLTATGSTNPLTWSVNAGSTLPPGLSLSAAGVLSGTPTTAGTSTFSITASDGKGASGTKAYSLRVNAALPAPVGGGTGGGDGGGAVSAPPQVCTWGCAVTWGDPHLTTLGGASYDFQKSGEFVAARASSGAVEVQVRQQPWGSSRFVSVNTAIAAKVAGHRVGLYLVDGAITARVDGATRTVTTTPTALPGGGTLAADSAGRRVVTWPEGTVLTVDAFAGTALALQLAPSEAVSKSVAGLLAAPVTTDAAADGLRISQSTSLFDYASSQSTSTFADRAFPYGEVTTAQLPAAQRDAAAAACRSTGVTDADALAACTLDVALTGSTKYAASAAHAEASTEGTTSSVLAHSAAGDAWKDASGATGTAELTYGHIGCSALDSASRCTGGTWSADLPGAPYVWSHRLTVDGQNVVTFTKQVTVTSAQAARGATFTMWSDDDATASVNGTPVLSTPFGSQQSAPVTLKTGTNTITVTVTNGGGFDPSNNPAGVAWQLTER